MASIIHAHDRFDRRRRDRARAQRVYRWQVLGLLLSWTIALLILPAHAFLAILLILAAWVLPALAGAAAYRRSLRRSGASIYPARRRLLLDIQLTGRRDPAA